MEYLKAMRPNSLGCKVILYQYKTYVTKHNSYFIKNIQTLFILMMIYDF
jgi:hypothetical protein